MELPANRGLACRLRNQRHHCRRARAKLISADTIEDLVRIAAAVSLLASYKIGRGGWPRSRQRVARVFAAGPRRPVDSRGRGSSPDPGPSRGAKPRRLRLHSIVAGAWIALSLAFIAYATIRGELALAELDGFDLMATYSLGPPAPPVDEMP